MRMRRRSCVMTRAGC